MDAVEAGHAVGGDFAAESEDVVGIGAEFDMVAVDPSLEFAVLVGAAEGSGDDVAVLGDFNRLEGTARFIDVVRRRWSSCRRCWRAGAQLLSDGFVGGEGEQVEERRDRRRVMRLWFITRPPSAEEMEIRFVRATMGCNVGLQDANGIRAISLNLHRLARYSTTGNLFAWRGRKVVRDHCSGGGQGR